MRVAALDCGTNALRLLIADTTPDGGLQDVTRRMETVRLGEGVDGTGRLSDAALARTFAGFEAYAEVIREHDVSAVRCVATSASRDAENRNVFVDGVKERIGVEPEVISGEEEAALSFSGATRGLTKLALPALIVDIGGGSTEFVLGDASPQQSWSTDMGCVRMTERHLHSDPPAEDEIDAVVTDVDAWIERANEHVDIRSAASIVGLAGTVTTVAAHAMGLDRYDADLLHGSRVPTAALLLAADELLHMTKSQRAALPFMHPGRVDVIGGGALVLARIARFAGLEELVVSEHDLLDGIAYSLAYEGVGR